MATFIQWDVTISYLDPSEEKLITRVSQKKTVNVPNATTEQNQPGAAASLAFTALALNPPTTFVDPISGNTINRSLRVDSEVRIGQVII